jgi:uncharacterized protein (TIGR00255 family)
MIHSMTGYGKGQAKVGDGSVTVELRTVNHRFIDFSIRIPRPLNGYEREIEKIVRTKVKRGHVYVTVTFDKSFESEAVVINRAYLRRTYRLLSDFAREEGISGTVDINALISLPDVFTNSLDEAIPESLWAGVQSAVGAALDRCVAMRRSEGAELVKDVARKLAIVERSVGRIEKRAPAAVKRALGRAKTRLAQLVGDSGIDESRWMTEAALMAERCDFTEELVRLRSHLGQIKTLIGRGDEVSKSLTFILQEIHRETTTMGNKAADASIIRECLAIKEVVEKIREQAQNLE